MMTFEDQYGMEMELSIDTDGDFRIEAASGDDDLVFCRDAAFQIVQAIQDLYTEHDEPTA